MNESVQSPHWHARSWAGDISGDDFIFGVYLEDAQDSQAFEEDKIKEEDLLEQPMNNHKDVGNVLILML